MKLKTSITLSPGAIKILAKKAKKMGMSKSSAVEMMIRLFPGP